MERLAERYAMYGFDGVVLVAKDGRVAFDRGFGVADRETRRPMTASTRFDAGSVMKTITAAAVVKLASEGKLRFSDRVSRYFDQLPHDITIEQLLLHRSGLPLDLKEEGDYVGAVAKAKLLFTPGEKYSYSNAAYGLLALIAERVSGEPFETFARRAFLEPAGMTGTRFWQEDDGRDMATPYAGNSDEEVERADPFSRTSPASRTWGKYVFGGGGIVTTTGDLYRWWTWLNASPLAPEVFRERVPNQTFGWNVRDGRVYRGGLVRSSYTSMVASYPAHDAVLIYLLNRFTGWHAPIEKNFARILNNEPYVEPPAVVTLPMPEVGGSYKSAAGTRLQIDVDGETLLVAGESQDALNILWSLTSEQQTVAARLSAAAAKEGVTVLGTTRHPSSPQNMQTFIRSGNEISRIISNGEKTIATGKGRPPASMRRFRRTGETTFASYDQQLDAVVTLSFDGDKVTITNDSIKASAIATRSPMLR